MTSRRRLRDLVGAWAERGACRVEDPAIFFPPARGSRPPNYRPALAVCARCEVRRECLRFALDTNQEDGVWGGTTPTERDRIRSGRAS